VPIRELAWLCCRSTRPPPSRRMPASWRGAASGRRTHPPSWRRAERRAGEPGAAGAV